MTRLATFPGDFYQLEDAILLPRPARPGGPPILIGGNGPRKTLPLVAKYADEWNAVYIDLPTYRERRALLADYIAAGRPPSGRPEVFADDPRHLPADASATGGLPA